MYDSLGGAHEVQITYQPATGLVNGGITIAPAYDRQQRRRRGGDGRDGVAVHRNGVDGSVVNRGGGQRLHLVRPKRSVHQHLGPRQSGCRRVRRPRCGYRTERDRGRYRPATCSAYHPVERTGRRQQRDAGRPRYGQSGRDRAFDFSNMTSLATAATANTVSQNGYTAGILSNITIGQDGTITGAFTNGQNTTLGRARAGDVRERGRPHAAGPKPVLGLGQLGTGTIRLRE